MTMSMSFAFQEYVRLTKKEQEVIGLRLKYEKDKDGRTVASYHWEEEAAEKLIKNLELSDAELDFLKNCYSKADSEKEITQDTWPIFKKIKEII
jgi:hypothetical protein